jgi:hypothetical protein
VVYDRLKKRNAASGGEEMLRLRAYEKLQHLVSRNMVKKSGKKYKGLATLANAIAPEEPFVPPAVVPAAAVKKAATPKKSVPKPASKVTVKKTVAAKTPAKKSAKVVVKKAPAKKPAPAKKAAKK